MCSLSSSRQIDIRRWQGILRSKLIAVRGHLKEEYKNRHAQSVTFCEAMCKRLERKNCSKKSEYGQVSILFLTSPHQICPLLSNHQVVSLHFNCSSFMRIRYRYYYLYFYRYCYYNFFFNYFI